MVNEWILGEYDHLPRFDFITNLRAGGRRADQAKNAAARIGFAPAEIVGLVRWRHPTVRGSCSSRRCRTVLKSGMGAATWTPSSCPDGERALGIRVDRGAPAPRCRHVPCVVWPTELMRWSSER